jgi:histidine ammonia-lyase
MAAPHSAPSAITLGDKPVDIADVARVSRRGTKVALTAAARQRIAADRAAVDRLAAGDTPIYGLTTGLGAAVDTAVPAEDAAAFHQRMLLARSVGIGPRRPRDAVRAAMMARIAGMAAGGSGISPAVLDALIALLNTGVHPAIPTIGSIGAADLAPLAHMALPLIGLGEAEFQGEVVPGADALRRAGLAPLELGPKDGLALINSNAASVGAGALVLCDIETALGSLDAAAALSLEGYRGNLSPLDPRAQKARPAPGQATAAARLTVLLRDSALWQPGAARRVQDPLSLRCISPVNGAALDALDHARGALEIELNGSGDNPLVVAKDGVMLSTGNFDVTALALGFEHLGQALAHAASLCAERTIKLLSPRFSELPRFLTPRGGTHTGFAAVQKTIAALEAEIRHRALPVSLGVRSVADGAEDHASLLPHVVAKTGEIVGHLHFLVAIELMIAAQALDLRPARLGPPLRAVYDAVRKVVPKLDEDRIIGTDIEKIATLVRTGIVG